MKVFGINTCTTYKKALKWFDDNNISYETVDLRVTPPSKEDIRQYHENSNEDIKRFFNTSGKLYRELGFKTKYKEMSLDEIYTVLANNPMLIKRPLVVDNKFARTGFVKEEYEKQWGKE